MHPPGAQGLLKGATERALIFEVWYFKHSCAFCIHIYFHRKIKLYIVHWLNSSIVLAMDHIKAGTGNLDQGQGQKLSHRTRTGPKQDCVTTVGGEGQSVQ